MDKLYVMLGGPERVGESRAELGAHIAAVKYSIKWQKGSLEKFNQQQATVIYHWLLYACRWKEYSDPESEWFDDIYDAIAY